MLPKEQQDSIAVMIGIEADVLAQAISDEQEAKLELPEGRFLTKENEDKLLDNHGKRKYDEGKSKTLKDVFEGKDKESFLNDYKTSVLEEAKAEPNEKLKEKEDAIKALQDSLKSKETEIESIKSEAEQTRRRATALSSMPTLREDLGLQKAEALNIILGSIEQKEDGIYKDGKLQVDGYQQAIKLDDFLKSEVESRGWTSKKIQGHGGKTGKPTAATPKTYTEYQKYCESKGWNEGSIEAKRFLNEVKAKNAEFSYDE